MRAFTPSIKAFATSALAAAAIAGGAGYAVAQDVAENPAPADAQTAAQQPGQAPQHDGHQGGRGGHGPHSAHGAHGAHGDRAERDGALAAKLGVSEQQLRDAMRSIHDQHEQSGAQHAGQEDRAQELADALGKDVQDVRTALDELRTEAKQAKRDELVTRLDEAVKAGTLASADKDSILKAFDAGVLAPTHPAHNGAQGSQPAQADQPSQQG